MLRQVPRGFGVERVLGFGNVGMLQTHASEEVGRSGQ